MDHTKTTVDINPGKYILVLKSNAALIRQNVTFIFTTPPNAFSIDKTRAFKLSKNCFVYKMGVSGGYMQTVISSTKSSSFQIYLNVPNKILGMKTSKPINILVTDLEGVILASYQGIKGSQKININKTNSIVKFTTNFASDAFVSVWFPD